MRTRHLVLYGRNIVESLDGQGGQGLHGRHGEGDARTYIDPRASVTACKATRYWQVRPNSDYALNLAIIHEVLQAGGVRQGLRRPLRHRHGLAAHGGQRHDAGMAGEPIPAFPPRQLRAFVQEIAGERPHVIFHPGWMTARHKQSFYVSRSALILNALMGNIEIPGGCVIAKPPEFYGRKSLKPLTARVPKVDEPRVDGAGTTRPVLGPGDRHAAPGVRRHGDRRSPTASAPTSPTATIRSPGMPDAEAIKRALDKLKLLVSIDVRYSETGWYSDVILPESTYLERANILAGCPARSRCSSCATRRSRRASTAVPPGGSSARSCAAWASRRRSTSRRSRRSGTTSSRARASPSPRCARPAFVRALPTAPKLTPRDKLRFPTPSGKIEIESEVLKTGRTAQPAALRAEGGARRATSSPAVLEDRDAGARPVPQQPAPARDRAGTGALDPPRPRPAARDRRRGRGRDQRGRDATSEGSRRR